MPAGWLAPVGIGNSVIVPLGASAATLLPSLSTNQTRPSGPAVIAVGSLEGVVTAVSRIVLAREIDGRQRQRTRIAA